MENHYAELERLFLGLGDKTRLRLLGLMANGPVPVGYLVEQLGESQPKVSRHLAYLRGAGLVETSRDGKWIYYGIGAQENTACGAILIATLQQLGDEQITPSVRGASTFQVIDPVEGDEWAAVEEY